MRSIWAAGIPEMVVRVGGQDVEYHSPPQFGQVGSCPCAETPDGLGDLQVGARLLIHRVQKTHRREKGGSSSLVPVETAEEDEILILHAEERGVGHLNPPVTGGA